MDIFNRKRIKRLENTIAGLRSGQKVVGQNGYRSSADKFSIIELRKLADRVEALENPPKFKVGDKVMVRRFGVADEYVVIDREFLKRETDICNVWEYEVVCSSDGYRQRRREYELIPYKKEDDFKPVSHLDIKPKYNVGDPVRIGRDDAWFVKGFSLKSRGDGVSSFFYDIESSEKVKIYRVKESYLTLIEKHSDNDDKPKGK